jgi:hypothetical protein
MENTLAHDIELYPPETFRTLLDHEVNRSHRYGDSLTLVDLLVEAVPSTPETQHSAEVFAINALNIYLRTTDIPCKKGNEFLILMPATGSPGARTACERLKKIMTVNTQPYDKVSFELHAFIGLATLPNNDTSVTSDMLSKHASEALGHARTNQLSSVIYFSDLLK